MCARFASGTEHVRNPYVFLGVLTNRAVDPAGGRDALESRAAKSVPGWLLVGFWGCIAISVAVVVRRIVALANPPRSSPPNLARLDAVFSSHATLTLLHIVPALAFVIVTPLVVFRRPRTALWPERLLFPLGMIVGITAYAMTGYAVGGWIERSAVLVFNSLFLFSLVRAWIYRKRGQKEAKRRWLLFAIVVLLGIATTRPVMGIFFATSRLTHLAPSQFFGIAFWIGFSINTAVAAVWLRKRRMKDQLVSEGAEED